MEKIKRMTWLLEDPAGKGILAEGGRRKVVIHIHHKTHAMV